MSIKNSDGETIAVSQEGTLAIEDFLKDNYLFRRNVLNGKVEFATLPADEPVYRVLTQQALNSIIIRAKREAVVEKGSPKSEIMELINSEEVPVYDPIREYLDSLPQWDGRNHVAQLFSRLPGISTEQHGFLAVWLRSAVAHWLQMDTIHGNECVPTLIGAQGCGKTTFVTRLLPSHLRQYFLDHLNLSNKFDKDIAEIVNACFRKPQEGDVTDLMSSADIIKVLQLEYPSLKSDHSTKVHLGLAMKELGFERTYRDHAAYYKICYQKVA